jgi:peptidoglycan/LPS O-acetylase OafA/YrhL
MTYRWLGCFRLLLAMLVMCQHYFADLGPQPLADLTHPWAMGSVAVLMFFVVSGFVITEAIDSVYLRRGARAFITNRLLRILPHFVIAVTLCIIAHAVFRLAGGVRLWRSQPDFPLDAFSPANILMNYVSVVPLTDRAISYNFLDIAWALRVEMAFYIIMAIGAGLTNRLRLPFAGVSAVLAAALLPLFALTLAQRGIAMMTYLPYFAAGVALYYSVSGRRVADLIVIFSVALMFVQCVFVSPTRIADVAPSLDFTVLLLAILFIIFGLLLRYGNRIGGRRLDRWLGDVTYPLYLYHPFILILVLTFTTGYSYAVMIGCMAASLALSALLAAIIDPIVARYRNHVRGLAIT